MWSWKFPASPVRTVKQCNQCGNGLAVHQKMNKELSFDAASISTSESLLQSTESRGFNRYLYAHVSSSIIHKSQMVEKTQKFINRQMIHKVWYTYMREYYSVFKWNRILMGTTPWMNPEDLMLSEEIQTPTHTKQIFLWFHLFKVLRIITVIRDSGQGGGYWA